MEAGEERDPRQGTRVVGDFVASIVGGKRQDPDMTIQGEFAEAVNEHL